MLADKLTKYLSSKEAMPPDEVFRKYAEEAVSAVKTLWEDSPRVYPRASSLHYAPRRMWFMRNYPEVKENFAPEQKLNFLQGHVWEAIYVLLLKEAGVNITATHLKGKALFGTHEVSGTLDIIVDDSYIVDLKCTNPRSYEFKFGSLEQLQDNDSYGYIEQAAAYESMHNKPFAGWFVIDPSKGRFKDLTVPFGWQPIQDAKKEIVTRLDAAAVPEMPEELCYPYEETKNRINLNTKCARCPFISLCMPAAVVGGNSDRPYAYIVKEQDNDETA